MSDRNLGIDISLALIRSLVCVYDVISYPIYALIQKPWTRVNATQRIKAKQNETGNPYSAWTRISHVDSLSGHFIRECETVPELFARAVSVYGNKQCFGFRPLFGEEDEKQSDGKVFRKQVLGDYQWFSYHEISKRVDCVAAGLLASGVRPKDNVVIFAETRIEWMITAQALFRVGATLVTLYATLGEEALIHGMNETEVQHVITNHDLLPKLSAILERTPHVRTIVYFEGNKEPQIKRLFNQRTRDLQILSFSQLEESGCGRGSGGRGGGDAMEGAERARPEDTAVLMYTSGSTGVPKAVMITHANLLAATRAFFTIAHALSERDVYCAYLPLAHVLEMAAELFFFSLGLSVGYATPLTLTDRATGIKKGTKGDTTLLKPTVMTAVPLILDRIRKGIEEQVQQKSPFARAIFTFAIDYKKFWAKRGFNTPVVNAVVCSKMKALLGGRLRLLAVGSAPLAPETHEFIRTCLDIELLQGYGLTETTASATLMDLCDTSVGRVGAPLQDVQIKLVDWPEGNYRVSDRPNPRGEIVVGGANITAGYYKNPELTKECYRVEDGITWFHTGDIGEVFPDGSVKIVDRKKDLVKLQFGEYISLGKIESQLKSCPLVDNICVYGNSFHSYLIALIVPNAKALQSLALTLHKENKSYQELCRDADVSRAVQLAVQEFGKRLNLHKMEIPTKVKLCTEEWLPDSGLVTAALKLRRKNIQDFYQLDINRLYGVENSKST